MQSLRSLLSLLTVLATAQHSFASSTVNVQHTVTPGSKPAVDESVFLRPAIDLQLNIYDYASLTPSTSHRFYYATNKGGTLHQVWVNYVFDMPLVALDHTAYIQQLRCFGPGGKHMIIQFSNKKAYNMALAWGKKMPMILSGYWHDGCKPKDTHAERYYAYASAVHTHPGLRELKFDVRFMSIHEVTQDMQINIGHPSGINKPTTSVKPTPIPTSTISYPAHVTSTPIPTTHTINYTPPTLPTPKTPDTTLEDFDVALDDKIGYWTDFGDAFTNQVFPGAKFSASKRDFELGERELEERAKISLPKVPIPKIPVSIPKIPVPIPKLPVPVSIPKPSSFTPTSLLKTALNTATTAVKQAAAAPLSQLTQTLKTVATSALAAPLKAIANTVASVIPPINLTPINTIWSWTLPPKALTPGLIQTPFGGSGVKFYEWSKSSAQANAHVTAYCVSCAVNGTFTIVGTLKANPLALKVEQAQLKISGPMMVNAEIGVVFNGGVALNFKKTLYSVPVNSFTIPGILEIGPKFSLDLNAALTSSMDGQMSIGQVAAWSPDFAVTLDLLHPLSSSVVNHKPTLTPFVHLNAALSLNMQGGASIGVPVSASLFKGKISYQAGMFAAIGLSTTLQANVQKGVPRVVRRDVMYDFLPGTEPHILGMPAPAIAARQDDGSAAAGGDPGSADSSVAASANSGPSCNGVFVGLTGFKSLYFAADGLGTKSFWGTTSTMGHWCQTSSVPKPFSTAPPSLPTSAPPEPPLPTDASLPPDKNLPTTTPLDTSTPTPTMPPADVPVSISPTTPTVPSATPAITSPPVDSNAGTAATTAVAAPTTSPAPVSPPAPTCEGIQQGAYSVSAAGAKYNVQCNSDYPGSDIATPSVHSFIECVAACDGYNVGRPGKCLGVSWVPGRLEVGVPACYLKGGSLSAPTVQTYEVDSAIISSAASSPVCSGVTSGALTTTPGGKYTVQCNTDYPGDDIATPPAKTFTQCINACDAWNNLHPGQCMGASWVPARLNAGVPACYLKGAGLPPAGFPDFEVDSALLVAQAPNPTCAGVPNGAYSAPNGAQYSVQCGWDYPGSDISWPNVKDFSSCIGACENYNAANPGACKGVAWVPSHAETWAPTCYLKGGNMQNPIINSYEVESAVLITAGTQCAGLAQVPYSATNGQQYQTLCNTDLPGSDVSTPQVVTFQQCIEACGSYNDENGPGSCVSISWVPSRLGVSTPCYLKNAVPDKTGQGFEVDSAILIQDQAASLLRRDSSSDGLAEDPSTPSTSRAGSFGSFTVPADFPENDGYDYSSFDAAASAALSQTADASNLSTVSVNATLPTEDAIPVETLGSAANDTNSTAVVLDQAGTARIQSADGSLYGFSTESGNLMLSLVNSSTSTSSGLNTGSFFQTTSSAAGSPLFADYSGRIMHIYQDETKSFNVTRLRFAEQSKIPLTSVFVTLSPLSAVVKNAGAQANTLVAITTAGDIYFLTACIYSANPSFAKVFAIKDNMAGDAKLESDALQTLVTGGKISSCSMISLQAVAL